MKRTKRYHLKTISEDGLLKDATNRYGDSIGYCMRSEEECWEVLERVAKSRWDGASYKWPVAFIVVCEWSVSEEEL